MDVSNPPYVHCIFLTVSFSQVPREFPGGRSGRHDEGHTAQRHPANRTAEARDYAHPRHLPPRQAQQDG